MQNILLHVSAPTGFDLYTYNYIFIETMNYELISIQFLIFTKMCCTSSSRVHFAAQHRAGCIQNSMEHSFGGVPSAPYDVNKSQRSRFGSLPDRIQREVCKVYCARSARMSSLLEKPGAAIISNPHPSYAGRNIFLEVQSSEAQYAIAPFLLFCECHGGCCSLRPDFFK